VDRSVVRGYVPGAHRRELVCREQPGPGPWALQSTQPCAVNLDGLGRLPSNRSAPSALREERRGGGNEFHTPILPCRNTCVHRPGPEAWLKPEAPKRLCRRQCIDTAGYPDLPPDYPGRLQHLADLASRAPAARALRLLGTPGGMGTGTDRSARRSGWRLTDLSLPELPTPAVPERGRCDVCRIRDSSPQPRPAA